MGGNEDPRRALGPPPTLFLGAGPSAEKTLAELSRLVQSLSVPIPGPFGLVLADSQGEELSTGDWPCASKLCSLEPASIRERREFVGRAPEKLATSLSSLVRRLRAVEPGAGPTGGGPVRLSAYVALDLSDPAAAACAVRLMQVLRQVDTAVETTVLALTGRTAAVDAAADGTWFKTCKTLLEQLQEGPLAQRVYLLDGSATDKSWLERPEQLHRLGGEFLFYHGITCRGPLRQNERARTGAGECLLNVCGSFGCRTIPADLSVVAERMAVRLVKEDLADLYKRTIPSAWLASLQEQARSLVERIATISEWAGRRKASLAGAPRRHPEPPGAENAEIGEAVRKTIQNVCTREPLVSLCLFFQLLRPKLARLLNHHRLWERARIRQVVAEAFRRQDENTYQPMRVWLARPQTRWIDRFTPAPPEVTEVAVSRPATLKSYLIGWLVLALGLIEVAAGVIWRDRLLAAAGGIVFLAATVPMTLPSGWARYQRHRPTGGDVALHLVPYRMGPRRWVLYLSLTLILVGLLGVTWPLWPRVWTPATALWALVLAALTGMGLAYLARGPRQTRPDQVSPKEAPGHASPPVWWRQAAGLLFLALAWTLFVLGSMSRGGSQMVDRRHYPVSIPPLPGLVLLAAGVGLVWFPRTGHTHLVDRVDPMPQRLTGGIANPVPPSPGPPGVMAMAAWVNHLALEPDQCLEPPVAKDRRPMPEMLLDLLAPDWESQLTRAFRGAIETRSGKSLTALAFEPALWAQCIASQMVPSCVAHQASSDVLDAGAVYDASRPARRELAFLFALQAVKAWIESHTLAELLSFLQIDRARFGAVLGRFAAAHWPAPRVDPERHAVVVAISKALWDVVAPPAASEAQGVGLEGRGPSRMQPPIPVPPASSLSPHVSFVQLDWDSHADKIVVLRTVQGLTQGWRGFPGLPGQAAGGQG